MTATLTPPGAKVDSTPRRNARPEAPTSPPTIMPTTPTGRTSAGSEHDGSQVNFEAHAGPAAVADRPPAPATLFAEPTTAALGLVDPLLILAAQALDDLEATRIANENRLRSLRDVYGLAGSSQEAEAAGLVDGLKALEHQAELSLKRALRRHPLGEWVKRTIGVGEKQGARLLSAIGDPYWNTLHNRPRTVAELWAYCGYHVLAASHASCATQRPSAGGASTPGGGDPGQRNSDTHARLAGVAPARARGQRANWSAEAKSRAWLIACSCIKQSASPYRVIYDEGRERYADATHQVECRRCGPSGKPAQPGTPISAGHQHARALRLVSKAILRDLWLEARAIHEGAKQ